MEGRRTLAATRRLPDWRRASLFTGLLVLGVLNVFLVGQALSWIINQTQAPDWIVFEEASRRVQHGESL